MAKRNRGKKKIGASNSTPGRPQDSITLRQEKTGKINPKPYNNVKIYLSHMEKLATWASGQASIPSLAAFFGQRFAAAAESWGFVPDASRFLCQRCETILQPGSNCSIRIEKNNAKRRRKRNKCSNLTQNNLVYYCHYCSCRNIKRGIPKGHMKVRYAQKSKAVEESESKEKLVNVKGAKECEATAVQMTTEILTIDAPTAPPTTSEIGTIDAPTAPPPATSEIGTIDAPTAPPPTASEIGTIDAPTAPPSTTSEIGAIEAPTAPPPTTSEIGTIDAPTAPPPTTGDALVVGVSEILPPRMEDILTINAPATPPTVSGTTLSKSQKRKRRQLAAKNQTGPENSRAPTDLEEKTGGIPTVDAPTTPPALIGMTLLESKKRKRKKPSSKNQTEPDSCGPTAEGDKTEGTSKTKRKRKSWTSLKEIAQTNEQRGKQNVTDLPIPFSLQGTF